MRAKENRFIREYYNYIWAVLVLIIALIYPNSLLRKGSLDFLYDRKIISQILKIAVGASILGCFSGYKSISKKYNFNFCIICPVFEEILFRGVIFIILINSKLLNNEFQMAIFSMVFSAFLFGIMHFQHWGFKRSSFRYVVLAFIGGYFFSYLVLRTQSILPTVFLHMLFNTSAIAFSNYKNKKLKTL
jgi:membrane protease YdiL (CAAX protease family)